MLDASHRVEDPASPDAVDYGNCTWCGSKLRSSRPLFCTDCKGPITTLAKWLYLGSFVTKSLAIPVAIGWFTFTLADKQQESAQLIASRQKLSDGLIEFDKNFGDIHLATRQILILSLSKEKSILGQSLKDAVLKLDLGMSLFGGKLIPFEEFARRMHSYGTIADTHPSPLQEVWDHCFVMPYWVDLPEHPAYFSQITTILSECDNTTCPTTSAARIFAITEELYNGHCRDDKPVNAKNLVWFDHQLRGIIIHSDAKDLKPFDDNPV